MNPSEVHLLDDDDPDLTACGRKASEVAPVGDPQPGRYVYLCVDCHMASTKVRP